MQIICGRKLSWFLQISLQSQLFSSENFLSYYKVFLGFKMVDSRPGSGPVLLRYFKARVACNLPYCMHCMGTWCSFLSIGSVYYLAMFKPCRKDSCQIPLPNPTQWSLEMFLGRCPLSHLPLYKLR